jgi:hypothetical protein
MAFPSLFAALRPFSPASPDVPDTPERLPLDHIRLKLHHTLHDCKRLDVQRLGYRINAADTAADLWLLRSDLYQCIARARDQAEAARRINAVLDSFSGWLPADQLTPI